MRKKNYFKIIIISVLIFAVAAGANAQLLKPDVAKKLNPEDIQSPTGKFAFAAGFSMDATIMDIVYVSIQGFLVLLGTIFIILIIYAGFLWMTAAGNEDQLKRAKSTIQKAVIGFFIIACAYSITYFVFSRLPGGQINIGGGQTM